MVGGGTFPLAYVYPREMRGTRDLLRRRTFLVRRRAELLAHIQNTFTQYNVASRNGRGRLKDGDPAEHFTDESVRYMLGADTRVVEHLDETIVKLESHLIRHAKVDDPIRFQLRVGLRRTEFKIGGRTFSSDGKRLATNFEFCTSEPIHPLAMTMLYETHDIDRFDNLGQFVSYARLVACEHESAGKKQGGHRSSWMRIGPAARSATRT